MKLIHPATLQCTAMGQIHQHQFANGLWLLAEQIENAQSLAMSWQVASGVAAEPADQQGVAALLAEMICRGAGDLDARGHSDALDHLGVQRGTSVETEHLRLGATMIGTKFSEALPLLTDMVRRPRLAKSVLEPSRDLALQSVAALEDEPQQKVFLELKQRHFPDPFGRSPLGVKEHLGSISLDQVQTHRGNTFVPAGSALGCAGRFDWPQLVDGLERQLGDWQGAEVDASPPATASRGYLHDSAETSQVHIGLMYDALPESDGRSILWRAAAAVLSGGMSGRLFTEVREKRGLCYAVYAAYAGHRDRGAIISYAGTSVPRAQETLDVLIGEHLRLSEGIEADEFERAIVGMKSRLVMQGESTAARARAIAIDQFIYGHPRSLSDMTAEVDAVTLDDLRQFVAANPPGPMTIVTIGPNALKVNG